MSSRYQRQIAFAALGAAGQQRLQEACAVVCGCGALGSSAAHWLVRAGVGRVRLIDRDFVEIGNLHRQALFDEADAAAALPKAVAAAQKLCAINHEVAVEPVVADLTAENAESLLDKADVIVDGTDNFETRFLVNDTALKLRIPWVYGGCVGMQGQTMTILPGRPPCLRCLMGDCPAVGTTETCETAGVLGPIVGAISAMQAGEAIKILSGHLEKTSRHLTALSLWDFRLRQLDTAALAANGCPACRAGRYDWLDARKGTQAAVLCGRNSVQIHVEGPTIALEALAARMAAVGPVARNAYLVRLSVEGHEIAVFADGRAIVSGTKDPAVARSLYARYVGC